MEHATLSDVVAELRTMHADVVNGLRRIESVLIESQDTQQNILTAIIDGGDDEPYTAEEFAAWREQFERDVRASALSKRAKNALIRAASLDNAPVFFTSYTGELLSFREWAAIVIHNPNRADHIYGFGARSIQALRQQFSSAE